MQYTVNARGITKSFGGRLVLDRVDLAIETGTVLALLGPNGAGKTTMVRILSTLVLPDGGTATIAGHDLLADPLGVRRAISLSAQYTAVDDLLSGQENLEMMARLWHFSRRAARARADELLGAFDLEDARHRRVSTYSAGMRRRLDLALSMVERPQLLFLDEPTTGLDPRSREQLWFAVRHLLEEGVTILLTTQYLEEADQLADTVALLDGGRIVAEGSADQLKASLDTEVLRLEFADAELCRHAACCLGAAPADKHGAALEVATDATAVDVHATLARLVAAGVPAERVSIRRPSLDDVYLSLTGSPVQSSLPTESIEVA